MNGIPELREKSAVMHTWFRCVVAVSGSAPVQCPTSEGGNELLALTVAKNVNISV